MWCLSPASVLWLLLLVHALLCSQLLPVVSGQTLYGCYPFTPANAQGQTISDGGVVGRNPRIVGILSWFSPSMDVMCNVSMLYADGAGYLTGPAHGYGDASCTSQQFAQGTQTYKMDWFYEGGSDQQRLSSAQHCPPCLDSRSCPAGCCSVSACLFQVLRASELLQQHGGVHGLLHEVPLRR